MSGQFITDVVIVSSKDACPSGYTLLNQTVNGNNADLYNSSLYKRGDRYLCFAKFPGSSTVVTDVNIVKEKDPVPVGYTAITNCKNDADEKVFRKHILCLKTDNTQKAQHCVSDIVLIQPSKGEETPGDFWRVTNDVNGLFLCYCTKPTQVQAVRQPPPYGHRTNMAYKHPNVQQSYPAAGNPYPVSSQQGGYPRMPFPQRPQQTVPTGNHPQVQAANKLCSAIQGVQFQVNPKFELLWKKADPLGNSTRTLSLDDIEKKYGYTFETEKNLLSSR